LCRSPHVAEVDSEAQASEPRLWPTSPSNAFAPNARSSSRKSERQRQREITPTRLEGDGCGHDSRLADDVAADHQAGPDLTDGASKACRDGDQHLR
jgi:hypothetical protein